MSNVPAHLPGDLGEHDPRREAHPHGNEPGAGGHEVKLGSNESKGLNSDATAAEHSSNRNPASDNTSEHAFNGGSVENMDRQKRQQASDIPGGRTGHDGVNDHLTRAGVEQGSHRGSGYDSGLTGNNNSGLTGSSHTGSGLTGSSHTGTGSGLVAEGERALHSGTHGTHGQTGYGETGYGSTGSGLTGSQTGYGQTGSGLTGSSGFTGSDPQERHQLHHGTAHHGHDFSHNHNTRTGELLDPASGRDTGIPGYAGGASGLTGSSHTGTGLTGSSHTGTGSGLVAEGERALHSGNHGQTGYGSTGSGLTGSHTGTGLTGSTGSGLTGSHTGSGLTGQTGYGQTGSTGERLREDVREGERAVGSGTGAGYGSTTGSGLTGSHTTGQTGSTGERLREDVREGEHATGHNTTGTTGTEHKKASLLDKLNPLKDSDGDGKKGFMK